MPGSPDTYTAAQAAQVIGVSERRVRQLVAAGALASHRDAGGLIRIPQQAVNEERKRRRAGSGRVATRSGPPGQASGRVRQRPLRAGSAPAPTARGGPGRGAGSPPEVLDVEELASAVASAVGRRIEGHLEITMRAESSLRQELDRERARRMEQEAKLADARSRLAEAQARVAELEQAEGQADQPGGGRRGLFRRR